MLIIVRRRLQRVPTLSVKASGLLWGQPAPRSTCTTPDHCLIFHAVALSPHIAMACILLRLQCCITTSSQDKHTRYYIGPDLLRMRSCVSPFATQVGSRETREFCETGASWEELCPTTHRFTFSIGQGTNTVAKVRHMEHMSSTYVHCEHVTCLLVHCRVPASCEVSHVNTAAGKHYSLLLKPQDLILAHCTEVTGVTYVRTAPHC